MFHFKSLKKYPTQREVFLSSKAQKARKKKLKVLKSEQYRQELAKEIESANIRDSGKFARNFQRRLIREFEKNSKLLPTRTYSRIQNVSKKARYMKNCSSLTNLLDRSTDLEYESPSCKIPRTPKVFSCSSFYSVTSSQPKNIETYSTSLKKKTKFVFPEEKTDNDCVSTAHNSKGKFYYCYI